MRYQKPPQPTWGEEAAKVITALNQALKGDLGYVVFLLILGLVTIIGFALIASK